MVVRRYLLPLVGDSELSLLQGKSGDGERGSLKNLNLEWKRASKNHWKMATLRFVDKSLSVFVGNLSTVVPHEEVEEVIYELFLQVSLFQKEGTLVPYFA